MIQLPEIDDDTDQFYCIRISSETLGDSIEFKNYELLKNINKTEIDNLEELKVETWRNIIRYDEKSRYLMI
jgi:hypothetical protein